MQFEFKSRLGIVAEQRATIKGNCQKRQLKVLFMTCLD